MLSGCVFVTVVRVRFLPICTVVHLGATSGRRDSSPLLLKTSLVRFDVIVWFECDLRGEKRVRSVLYRVRISRD